MTAPPMAYYGGKTRLAAKIAALLPDHEHYVEPFAGSLAVLLAKKPSRMETVNDLDQLLMTFWRVLREQPDELVRLCALTPHSRAELDRARLLTRAPDDVDLDDLERARQVWVAISQARGGTLKGQTGWRTYINPGGSKTSMPGYLDSYVDRMSVATHRLHRVSLECRPALEIVEKYGAHRYVCLYVDPPYPGSTRSDGGQGGGNGYRCDMKADTDHIELLTALKQCEASVLLSSYPSELYTAELAGWDRLDIPTFTGQARVARARTEVLWSNRPISSQGTFDFVQEPA